MVTVSRKTKLDNLSPYAKPYGPKDLEASMIIAEMSKGQVAMLCDVTPRAVEQWLSGRRPVPVLVRKVMRGIALGLLPKRTLEAL